MHFEQIYQKYLNTLIEVSASGPPATIREPTTSCFSPGAMENGPEVIKNRRSPEGCRSLSNQPVPVTRIPIRNKNDHGIPVTGSVYGSPLTPF